MSEYDNALLLFILVPLLMVEGISALCQNAPPGWKARQSTRNLRIRAEVSAKKPSATSSEFVSLLTLSVSGMTDPVQLVEQLHNKLRSKMSEKLNDPFSILPLEITTMVLQYFNFKQIVWVIQTDKWKTRTVH